MISQVLTVQPVAHTGADGKALFYFHFDDFHLWSFVCLYCLHLVSIFKG